MLKVIEVVIDILCLAVFLKIIYCKYNINIYLYLDIFNIWELVNFIQHIKKNYKYLLKEEIKAENVNKNLILIIYS
jgi:hypothetical protein